MSKDDATEFVPLGCKTCPLRRRVERILAELQAENEKLKMICWRESIVLREALKRKNNRSMIAVVADSLAEQFTKGD